jgi:hypothetical protein
MTDDEKRQQRAMLLLEYEETRQHYKDLTLKASKMKQELEEWASLLQKGSFLDTDLRYAIEFTNLKTKLEQEAESRAAKVNLAEVLRVANEMGKTHQKLTELSSSKKAYGF